MKRGDIQRTDIYLTAAVLFGCARFFLLADRTAFVDEQAGIVRGWLLSEGLRLYDGVFSHHLPFEHVVFQAAASPGPGILSARCAAAAIWASACAAIYLLLRRRAGAWTGVCYALLTACWAPLWWGHLLLVELHWCLALTVLVAAWGEPLGAGRRQNLGGGTSSGDASVARPALTPSGGLAVGALAALAATASLPAPAPTILVLSGMALTGCFRRRAAYLLAGAGAFLAVLALWGLKYAAWGGFYEQGIRFNFAYYARFTGYDTPWELYLRQIVEAGRHWLGFGTRSWSGIEPLLTATVLGACAVLWRARGARWGLGALLCFVLVRVPVEAPGLEGAPLFHASAYYSLAVLALCAGMRPLHARSERGAAAVLLALAAVTYPAWRPRAERTLPREKAAVARLANSLTQAHEPVLALPAYPLFYIVSRRKPAIPHILYLPWVAAAQEKRALDSLKKNRPAVVFLEEGAVGGTPWHRYGGPILDWIMSEYQPYFLDSPYGGRLAGRAERTVWADGIYLRRDRERELLRRARRERADIF